MNAFDSGYTPISSIDGINYYRNNINGKIYTKTQEYLPGGPSGGDTIDRYIEVPGMTDASKITNNNIKKNNDIPNNKYDLGMMPQTKFGVDVTQGNRTQGIQSDTINQSQGLTKTISPEGYSPVASVKEYPEQIQQVQPNQTEFKPTQSSNQSDSKTTKDSKKDIYSLPPELIKLYTRLKVGEHKDYKIKKPYSSNVGANILNSVIQGAAEGGLENLNQEVTSQQGENDFMNKIVPAYEKATGKKVRDIDQNKINQLQSQYAEVLKQMNEGGVDDPYVRKLGETLRTKIADEQAGTFGGPITAEQENSLNYRSAASKKQIDDELANSEAQIQYLNKMWREQGLPEYATKLKLQGENYVKMQNAKGNNGDQMLAQLLGATQTSK